MGAPVTVSSSRGGGGGEEEEDDEMAMMPTSPVLQLVAESFGPWKKKASWKALWRVAFEAMATSAGSSPAVTDIRTTTLPPPRPLPTMPRSITHASPHKARAQHHEGRAHQHEDLLLPDVVPDIVKPQPKARQKKQSPLPRLGPVGPRPHSETKRDSPSEKQHTKYSTTRGRNPRRNGGQRAAEIRDRDERQKQARDVRNRQQIMKPVIKRQQPSPPPTGNVDGNAVLLREMLNDVSRRKREKLLEMLLDIEVDLAESPLPVSKSQPPSNHHRQHQQ